MTKGIQILEPGLKFFTLQPLKPRFPAGATYFFITSTARIIMLSLVLSTL